MERDYIELCQEAYEIGYEDGYAGYGPKESSKAYLDGYKHGEEEKEIRLAYNDRV
jgi:hypothetical protein